MLAGDEEMGRRASEVDVLTLVPVACPAGITLVACCAARRNLACNSDVNKLVQLGGAVALELWEVGTADGACALRRDPIEEAAVDAATFLLCEGLLGSGEPAVIEESAASRHRPTGSAKSDPKRRRAIWTRTASLWGHETDPSKVALLALKMFACSALASVPSHTSIISTTASARTIGTATTMVSGRGGGGGGVHAIGGPAGQI